MKTIFRIFLLILVFGILEAKAKDLIESNNLSFGVNLNTGTMMGAGAEFGFLMYKNGDFEIFNFISLNSTGLKLTEDKFDYVSLFAQEKITFSYLLGSSVVSHIGFDYFRPYLFISGGFGGIFGKKDGYKLPYYWDGFAGLGHEFITQNGHTFFFELGGGAVGLTSKLSDKKLQNTLGGNFRVILGYRIYF